MKTSYKNQMNTLNKTKVMKSEMIIDYDACREKTESLNRTLTLENNPTESSCPCTQYEKLLVVIKYLDSLENEERLKLSYSLPKEGFRERDIVNFFYCEAQKNEEIRAKKDGSN